MVLISCKADYIKKIQLHFERFLTYSEQMSRELPEIIWPSSIDYQTGKFPVMKAEQMSENVNMPEGCTLLPGKRAYRNIDAPNGCAMYWDQPLLAAYMAMQIFQYKIHNYINFFMECCVAENGAFLWGNHYYYVFEKKGTVFFVGDESPRLCDKQEAGLYHELRPFSPAWDLLWQVSAEKTERHIRFMAENHVFNEQGGFNRHADKQVGCAFLESGGVLVESLCWLYQKTKDQALLNKALAIANYSFSNRNPNTNLVENNPTEDRWDKFMTTSEVGLWANSLLRAMHYSGEKEFMHIADRAVKAFLTFGYDKEAKAYYGKLYVESGMPCTEERTTLYQPKTYSDMWEYVFPSHDYLMSLALSAVKLYELTGESIYQEAVERFAGIITKEQKKGTGVLYAEQLGRCIWFLMSAYEAFEETAYQKLAIQVADDAVEKLWQGGMFRSHTGEDNYSSVDGLGFLFLALIYVQTGQKPNCMGFGF